MKRFVNESRTVTLDYAQGELPLLEDTKYVSEPIVVDRVFVYGLRSTARDWSLLDVEVIGSRGGTGARRKFRGSHGVVYALADMPEWLRELATTELAKGI